MTHGTAVWILTLATFSATCAARPAILQRGYDHNVSGAVLSETTLTTSNVSPSTFGLKFTLPVDGTIFAQPLYVPDLPINHAPHNVLFVATMNDSLYAFDADHGGAPLWHINLASLVGARPVPIGAFTFSGNRNIVGNLGILSTPVIDLSIWTLYVVTATQEGISQSTPDGSIVYRLHAINITTGNRRPGSGVRISGSYNGATFDARYLTQRMSLVLVGRQVVIGFGALELEYAGSYSGWVMAYDKFTLAQSGVFATVTTGNRGGGVWQSGRPPVVDGSGYVYLFTGNGYSRGYDGVHDFAESVVKLDPAGGLKLCDWYTPGNWAQLDAQDMDLASSGPLLIPGTNLLAGGGKRGEFYLLNSASLGKYNAQDAQVVQKLRVSNGEIRGGAVYWQRSAANGGPLLFVWGQGDRLKAYPFNGQRLAAAPMAQGSYANELFPGGILTLSANGDAASSGILWAATAASGDAADNPPVTGVLHAFKAANVAEELWNTNMVPARDGFGGLAKFVPPVVANGKVYLASWSNQVAVYGLLH